MRIKQLVFNGTGWLSGLIFFIIGIINAFWGNDPFYGIFVLLCSFLYFPPFNSVFKRTTGFVIPPVIKILLGLFILWTALGVAELFDKTEMMMRDLLSIR